MACGAVTGATLGPDDHPPLAILRSCRTSVRHPNIPTDYGAASGPMAAATADNRYTTSPQTCLAADDALKGPGTLAGRHRSEGAPQSCTSSRSRHDRTLVHSGIGGDHWHILLPQVRNWKAQPDGSIVLAVVPTVVVDG